MSVAYYRSGLKLLHPMTSRMQIMIKRFLSSQVANKFDAQYLSKNQANFAQLSPISQLNKTVQQYPNVTCYVHGDISRTWREVDNRIRRFASAINTLGIAKNDVVSIIAPNTPAIFEAHFAVPATGAVLHSLNTRSDARTIAFQLKHAETKYLLVDTEFSAVVQSALALMADSQNIIVVQILDDPKYPISGKSMLIFSFIKIEYLSPRILLLYYDLKNMKKTS